MDHHLLEQLYDAYYHELYIYVYSLCKSHSAAEDILQETFLKAILSLPETHGNMRAWLYRVARNLTFNLMKRDKYRAESKLEPPIAQEDEPLEKLLRNETYQVLYEGITNLSKVKKEVLVMQYFSQLSLKEIAVIMHISPENVRVIASRARKELRTYMEGKEDDLS
ncbi:RNA polymerase sigma factor sigM [uncultured Eubacterium sp.]|nr:RNA polymerase sigma factor sigM [uncultured Eubacterium sp.]